MIFSIFSVGVTPVIIGAVLSFLIGWAWYSPFMFLTAWADGNGIAEEHRGRPQIWALVGQGVALLLLAWVVGFVDMTGGILAFGLMLAAMVAFYASTSIFSRKPLRVVLIETGYLAVALVIMHLVHGIG